MTRRVLYIVLALLTLSPPLAWAADYQVIAHPTNPRSSITVEEIGKIFLKRIIRWDAGTAIVPVHQASKSAIRAVFTQDVHGKSVAAISAQWRHRMFSGGGWPPIEKAGDSAVVKFVRANEGALGYVSARAPVEGVKVFVIK